MLFAQVRTWKTGILVYLTGSAPEKTIGWRADIDGLPIVEETELGFKSLHPDRMHACGHDFHMTIALGLLEKMAEQQPRNNLLFLFQPAEENLAGGMLMYEAGLSGIGCQMNFMGSMSDLTSKSVKWPPTVRPSLLEPVKSRYGLQERVATQHFPIPPMTPWWQPATL